MGTDFVCDTRGDLWAGDDGDFEGVRRGLFGPPWSLGVCPGRGRPERRDETRTEELVKELLGERAEEVFRDSDRERPREREREGQGVCLSVRQGCATKVYSQGVRVRESGSSSRAARGVPRVRRRASSGVSRSRGGRGVREGAQRGVPRSASRRTKGEIRR